QVIPGVMCLLLLFKTMASQYSVLGGVRGHMDFSIWHVIAVDTTILWRYIGLLFWPADLCVLYDPPTSGIWKTVAVAAAAWSCVAIVFWKYRTRYPVILWSAATFLLLLLPVLNFFKITTLMNDRYLYLPCITCFALLAACLQRFLTVTTEGRGRVAISIANGAKWMLTLGAVSAA
ncbi:MAG: hypothetical protein GY758_31975, partial [Fuerstiella sp.]|nr:hypothetical protein [Fuerstiella sp.]